MLQSLGLQSQALLSYLLKTTKIGGIGNLKNLL